MCPRAPCSPGLTHSRLGEREDLVEDFSERDEEFLLEAPVTERVEWPESSGPQQREENDALRLRPAIVCRQV